jgi:hypothetical protein
MPTLTGKTIEQLTQITGLTSNSFFPVSYSGLTYKVPYSAITNYYEVTYDDLYSLYTGSTLTPGGYYLMTDFQTCYDQPNFDYNGDPIITGNYKSGSTEPLLLMATATDKFSSTVFSPQYPFDKITYDITWDTTEVTGGPAKGRITERIDEFNNRTDYDHRTVLFRRYKSYFQDGNIQGRIIEMNNGLVTGLNTNFTADLITGDTIWIMSQVPMMYEVININSVSGMTVAGFNYQNFSDPVGFECEVMITQSADGTLYYFNDVPDIGNDIDDGGDDMYDGANKIYTNLFSIIPYTHTQMTDPPINDSNEAIYGDFTYDGTVQSGDTYFNSGSTYFTNCYPGLFVMSAYDVDITDFEIDGNIGANGDGQADTYDYTLSYSGIDYSVYTKQVWDAGDPSINHIYIVDTIDSNITHNIDTSTDDDLDTISNLTGVTQIHYLLFALSQGVKPTNNQIENVVTSYLSLIDPTDINVTLSNLNTSFSAVTDNLPPHNQAESLNYKQTNLTGDTNNYQELLTFGNPSDRVINNYIGNYANTFNWDNNTFLLSNNVFYGNGLLDYVNNTFGDSCYNNTFDDDCTNNIIGNFFYNNTTDDDFDGNLIGNDFHDNYITANFQRNRIGDNFNNNTMINGLFYRNDIGNQFENNVITNDDFQQNKIGADFLNNNILGTFAYNEIGNYFQNNTVGDGFGYGISTSQGNKIGNYFYNNTIGESFYNNVIADGFYENTIGDYFQLNDVKFSLYSTNFSGATHVYGDYNCTLFKNSAPLSRLSYYDGSDVLTITNITA